MLRRGLASALLLLFVLWAPTPAAGKDDPAPRVTSEPGAAAPENCWLMPGACPARTCESLTVPVSGEMDIAWTLKLPKKLRGKVVESPLLWHERVIIPVNHGGGRHSLHVRNLHDGTEIVPPVIIDSSSPILASLWNDRVLIRKNSRHLVLYQMLRGKLREVWDVTTSAAIRDTFFYDGTVWVREGDGIVTYRPPDKSPSTFPSLGLTLRGGLAMRGGIIYSVHYDKVGNAFAVALNGGRASGYFAGHHGARSVPDESLRTHFVVGATDVMIHHGQTVRAGKTQNLNTTAMRRDLWHRRRSELPEGVQPSQDGRNLFSFRAPVACTGGEWFGVDNDKKGPELLLGKLKQDGGLDAGILSSPTRLPKYTRFPAAMSSARGVMYIGASAVRAKDSRVLWEGDMELALPPIPAKGRLLVVNRSGVFHALGPRGEASSRGIYFGPLAGDKAAASHAVAKGLILHASGDEQNKPYEISCTDGICTVQATKNRVKKYKLSDLRLLLDDEGRPLYAESLQDLPAALDSHYFYGQADDVRKLAKEAYKTGDPELMDRLIRDAENRAVSERNLRLLRKMHKGLVERPRKHDESKTKRVLEKAAGLEAERKEQVTKTLATLLDDPRRPVQLLALRELLRVDPNSSVGRTAVRERLPEFLRPKGDWDANAWLGVATAIEGKPFRSVLPPLPTAETITPQQRELGAALSYWRKDLVAFETDSLMIMTPLRAPGPIAKCLVLGDLVCRALEEVFGGVEDSAIGRYPMILQLFDTHEAYLKWVKQKLGARDSQVLSTSAGHYDPNVGVSRLFLPDGDDGWELAMETYAHELTHHWIDLRCPLFRSSEIKQTDRTAGMWIVEGMAELVAEFRWDLSLRTWDTYNRQSSSLDLIANIGRKNLMSWDRYYALGYAQFARLDRTRSLEVPLRWKLGYHSIVTQGQLFYAQAGATCQYLYHQGGALREGLRKYVHAYYTGALRPGEDGIQKYFGMSPFQLGKRVEAFARLVSDGKFRPSAEK